MYFLSMRPRRRRPIRNPADFRGNSFIRRVAGAAEIRRALKDPQAQIYQALEDRRANLDRRVKSGEIDSYTRERYMRVYRVRLIESLGYGRPGLPERILVAVLVPLLARARRMRHR